MNNTKNTIIRNCRLFDSMQEKTSVVFNERIIYRGPDEYAVSFLGDDHSEIDAEGMVLCPGFIDIHNHGGAGNDFAVCDPEGMEKALRAHLVKGTTTVLPTAASASTKMILDLYNTYRIVLKGPYADCVRGIHLEGPFLNPAKKGAMPEDLLRLPTEENYAPLLEEGSGILKRMTIAPELPGAYELGEKLAKMGINVSAGHTEATPEVVREASKHGFNLATHIFNAMTAMHKEGIFRKAGAAEAMLSDDSYYIEGISDCIHIPPEILRMCWQIKGTSKMILITDAISASGADTKEGEKYAFVDSFIWVEDGIAKLPDRSAIAGSLACGISMLKSAVRAGIPFVDSVKMMTETPAKLCGFDDIGKILPGYKADLVLIDENNDLRKVIKSGRTVV